VLLPRAQLAAAAAPERSQLMGWLGLTRGAGLR
jgi:hypothetical protein